MPEMAAPDSDHPANPTNARLFHPYRMQRTTNMSRERQLGEPEGPAEGVAI